MPYEQIQGQESGSPTDTPGQVSTDTPISDTDKVLNALKAEEDAAGKEPVNEEQEIENNTESELGEGETGETDEKPAPYDKDPKWKAARAAEKRMQDVLERAGLDSFEELQSLVDEGQTLKEILGGKDLKQLIKDANRLQEIEAYWAEQKALEQEESEEPHETIARLKKEKQELADKQAREAQMTKEQKEAARAIETYNKSVSKVVESSGLEGEKAEMAKLMLGVDNPFNEIDIDDPKAVREMSGSITKRFSDFVAKIEQAAIDKYAAGKSDIVPITPASTPASEKVLKTRVSGKETIDEANADAKGQLLEMLSQLNTG